MVRTRRRFSLLTEGVVVAVAALIGLRVGLVPIRDNSAFTHLATGIEMVRHGWVPAIPRVDPYTFTAHGHAWVVQSWLSSWIVGVLERAFGSHAVLLLAGVTASLVAFVMARLARTGSALRTAGALAVTLLVADQYWAPRPLMAGLLCFGLTVLIVVRQKSLLWLVPLAWCWVQTHGSFPLGLVFVGALWAGSCIDARSLRGADRALWAGVLLSVGVALGSLNPLGPKLVLFPATALSKREVFRHIVEWRTLSFDTREGAIAIVGITIAVAILIRRRIPWRVALPVAVFVLLSWSARRNVPTLAIVLAWALGEALRVESPDPLERHIDPIIGAAIGVMGLLFVVTSLQSPALDFRPYPVASVRWAERHGRFGAPHRVLSRDFVGNYLELRHGPSGDVWVDDRVDMFPREVPLSYFELLKDHGTLQTLERWKIDTVIWPYDHPVTRRLRKAGWRIAFSQQLAQRWVVLIRSEA